MSGFHYISTTLFVPNAKAPVSILRRALSRDQNPIPKFTIPYGRHLSFRQVRTPNRELTIFSRLSPEDAKKIQNLLLTLGEKDGGFSADTKRTMNDIKKKGQLELGIITQDGFLIDEK